MSKILSTNALARDFVGYEALVRFMKERKLQHLEGDIVEIGAFMGGGTAKLARFAQKYGKKVYAIDIFDPSYDRTQDASGFRMCDIYEALLRGRSQWDVYQDTTRGFGNLITLRQDSKQIKFPDEQRFIFGFVDGNHRPDYVRNDFYVIWPHIIPGGALGFHDYNYDLPEVTKVIDTLLEEHKKEIRETRELGERHVILLVKG